MPSSVQRGTPATRVNIIWPVICIGFVVAYLYLQGETEPKVLIAIRIDLLRMQLEGKRANHHRVTFWTRHKREHHERIRRRKACRI